MDVKQIGGPAPRPGRSGLARIVGSILFAAVLVAGFMFSLLVFAILLVVAVVAGGWWWWKTRHLRRELRERMEQMAAGSRGRAGGWAGDRGRGHSRSDER